MTKRPTVVRDRRIVFATGRVRWTAKVRAIGIDGVQLMVTGRPLAKKMRPVVGAAFGPFFAASGASSGISGAVAAVAAGRGDENEQRHAKSGGDGRRGNVRHGSSW